MFLFLFVYFGPGGLGEKCRKVYAFGAGKKRAIWCGRQGVTAPGGPADQRRGNYCASLIAVTPLVMRTFRLRTSSSHGKLQRPAAFLTFCFLWIFYCRVVSCRTDESPHARCSAAAAARIRAPRAGVSARKRYAGRHERAGLPILRCAVRYGRTGNPIYFFGT